MTTKFARIYEFSAVEARWSRKPSNTVLAFVSPGCTREVTKMILRLDTGIEDLVAVMDMEGTGRPEIVVHRSERS